MKLVFISGPPAAGKYTVARKIADRTGLPLFHNHLVVDAVGAVFPFGSPAFVTLRERFWLEVLGAAARERRSLIFTFQPESSVAPDFALRASELVAAAGGETIFIQLRASLSVQEARIANQDRAAFGKLRDVTLLRALHRQFEACERAMPPAALVIDTEITAPDEAATLICDLIG